MLNTHTKKLLMTLNPKHECYSYFMSYSQLLLYKMTAFTSPLLHIFKSPTHQQKTFKRNRHLKNITPSTLAENTAA